MLFYKVRVEYEKDRDGTLVSDEVSRSLTTFPKCSVLLLRPTRVTIIRQVQGFYDVFKCACGS